MDGIKLDSSFSVALICESMDDISSLKRRIGIYSNGVTVFSNLQDLKNELSAGNSIDIIFFSISSFKQSCCTNIAELKEELCQYIPIIIISNSSVSQLDMATAINAGVDDILCNPLEISLLKARLFKSVKQKMLINSLEQKIKQLNDSEETYLDSKLSEALRIQTSRLQSTLTNSFESIVNLSNNALNRMSLTLKNDENLNNAAFMENFNVLREIEKKSVYCSKILKYFADHNYLKNQNFAMDLVNKVVIDTVKLFVYNHPKIDHKIDVNLDRRISKKLYISSEALGNAIYAIIENASFFVSICSREQSVVSVTTKLKFDCVEIVIKDNGLGISEDEFGMIFKPFFSTIEGKVGLGLFCAKELIDMHKGTISVNSKIGEYSEFTISIPIVKDAKK